MSCMVHGEVSQTVASGLKSVRAKMDAIISSTKQEAMREKRAKEAITQENARERAALNRKRALLDQIQKVEKDIEKIEAKESYAKERMYFAHHRFDENTKMKRFLETNKVDVGALEVTMEQYREKKRQTVQNIARIHKSIHTMEKLILAEEKREMVARDSIARLREKLNSMERSRNSVVTNYSPLSNKEYQEKLDSLCAMIAQATEKRRRMERKADVLEKNILELEKNIAYTKKRNEELKQTTKELRGSRV